MSLPGGLSCERPTPGVSAATAPAGDRPDPLGSARRFVARGPLRVSLAAGYTPSFEPPTSHTIHVGVLSARARTDQPARTASNRLKPGVGLRNGGPGGNVGDAAPSAMAVTGVSISTFTTLCVGAPCASQAPVPSSTAPAATLARACAGGAGRPPASPAALASRHTHTSSKQLHYLPDDPCLLSGMSVSSGSELCDAPRSRRARLPRPFRHRVSDSGEPHRSRPDLSRHHRSLGPLPAGSCPRASCSSNRVVPLTAICR